MSNYSLNIHAEMTDDKILVKANEAVIASFNVSDLLFGNKHKVALFEAHVARALDNLRRRNVRL